MSQPSDIQLHPSILGSELPGTGSSVPCLPTGDGEAMSHSAPLEVRTLSFAPSDDLHSPAQSGLPLQAASRTRTGDGEHLSLPEPVGGPHLGAQGAKPPHYPDYIAQSYKSVDLGDELGLQGHFEAPPVPAKHAGGASPENLENGIGREDLDHGIPEISCGRAAGIQLELACPSWGMFGECQKGHHYAKELICGREWCRSCGGKQGKNHQRRKSGWLPRATQMRQMGYFVITIPPELRTNFRSLDVLRTFGIAVKKAMKRHGFARGLRRWHWFGEDHPGHGLQGDGLPVYHPHLNLLVEAGWLPFSKLQAIRRSVAKILRVSLARVVVHYEFASSVSEMLHMVKYVLRPTFSCWEWDPEMAYNVIGFRHTLPWGTWHEKVWDGDTGKYKNGDYLPPVWEVPAADSDLLKVVPLEHGRCPVDGTEVTWGEVRAANLLVTPWWADVGGGYWAWTGLARDGPG